MATQSASQAMNPPVTPPALPSGALPGLPGNAAFAGAPAASSVGLSAGQSAGPNADRAELDSPVSASPLRLAPSMVRLPVDLQVMVPVREFRVRNLLAMVSGEVIQTRWANGEDLPLSSGQTQLAWTEFEVVDSRLAVRVTRLA